MPRFALALVLCAGLALAACGGGDDETTTVEAGASTEAEDTEAIESLITDYGLTDDPAEGCKLFSLAYLADLGGATGCMSYKFFVEELQIEGVSIDGDGASVMIVREDGRRRLIPVVREGEPSDAYDGWLIAGDPETVPEAPEDTQTAPVPVPETDPIDPADKTDQLPLGTPEERATAYRNCIGTRGAKNIKEDDFPSVTFSGGGSLVQAMFGSSAQDAQEGLATLRQRKPFFAGVFGTVVLFTVDDPLADDLEIGISCAKSYG